MSEYIGNELELFLHARNWKSYWSGVVQPYVNGDVGEVGSGIGANTAMFCQPEVKSLTCIEPDPRLLAEGEKRQPLTNFPIQFFCGTLDALPPASTFDTLAYIDVVEHIENDQAEVRRAIDRLSPGGHLIVLCPAHQWLFSPFDKAIGHYRRYNRNTLSALFPSAGGQFVSQIYLDSVGLLASLLNRLMLRQSMPTASQIKTWDQFLVPLSRIVDPLIGRMFGKTVVVVWRKSA